ncbi:MAG: arginine repressor [Candidatus Dormibacteraceae bacterium]
MTQDGTAGPKQRRRRAILDVISAGAIHTQRELAAALAGFGLQATQATVSRDVQELGLVRTPAGYRQVAATVSDHVLSITVVQFLAVVRTPPGTANLVARAIDETGIEGVAGTVAGDDTAIVVLTEGAAAGRLKTFLQGGSDVGP